MAPRVLDPSRRRFLTLAAAAMGTPQVIGFVRAGSGRARAAAMTADAVPAAGLYRCLDRTEAAFIEAIARTLCPADDLTPDGVDCGVAAAFDDVLARTPPSDRTRIARELRLAARAWRRESDRGGEAVSVRWINDLFAGRIDVVRPEWAHRELSPILIHACFAEAVYDSYDNRVFWKMFAQA